MKYLKMLGLAAVAAMALAAFGASTASATEVYAGNTTYTGPIAASLEPGTTLGLTDTAGNAIDTCTSAAVNGTISTAGSSTTTTSGAISKGGLIWGTAALPCKQLTVTLSEGELEIHHIAGTDNGTLTGKGNLVTISVFGVSCRYGTGAGTALGTLTGKTSTTEHATMDINAIINEQEPKQFLCPDTAKWVGSYTVTTPTGLNVRAS